MTPRASKPLLLTGLLLLGVGLLSGPLSAQESRRGDRVLHRHLDAERASETQRPQPRSQGVRPAPDSNDRPGLWVVPNPDEWILTAHGPVGPRRIEAPHGPLDGGQGTSDLDDQTDRVDQLDYQASFDPSVVPFKRGVAQNRIRRHSAGRYSAWLERGAFESVDIEGGGLLPGEERFWGSFLLSVEPGQRQSVPSVSPEQRVLRVENEPNVALRIERDGAGNFYVRADHEGLLRVNMEIAVSREYFDGALRPDRQWEDFARPGELLDREIQQIADGVVAELGIDRSVMSPLQALERLVEHYRDFEGRPFPRPMERDRYVEITREKVGVCRHRSLTFMISARSLGIETHYVYNEAHAFVEIYWPGQGWRRIDLGGAADAFNYHNNQGGRVHDGGLTDGLPRPPAYEEEMARMAGADTGPPGPESGLSDASSPSLDEAHSPLLEEPDLDTASDQVSEPQTPQPALTETPRVPRVELLEADGEVLRGHPLRVRGRAFDESAGETVEIYLIPGGMERFEAGVLLGEAEVAANGEFEGQWTVPREVGLGRWRLKARIKP